MKKHRLALSVWTPVLLVCGGVSWGGESTSEINGRIVDTAGNGIANALVFAHKSSVDGPLEKTETRNALSDAKGRFNIEGLASGPYWICVVTPERDFLDPCVWSRELPLVRVTAGKKAQATEIKLERGVMIRTWVQDPDQIVQTPFKMREATVEPGAYVGGKYHPAAWSSYGRRGHEYVICVPQDTDVDYVMKGEQVDITDDQNTAVDSKSRKRIHTGKHTDAGADASKNPGKTGDSTDPEVQFTFRAKGPKK